MANTNEPASGAANISTNSPSTSTNNTGTLMNDECVGDKLAMI